jgi:hypothetical protein
MSDINNIPMRSSAYGKSLEEREAAARIVRFERSRLVKDLNILLGENLTQPDLINHLTSRGLINKTNSSDFAWLTIDQIRGKIQEFIQEISY